MTPNKDDTRKGERRRHHPTLDKETAKDVVKEALKEWLDEKYLRFGKWSFHGILAMLLAVVVYFFMISSGWHR